MKLNSKNNLWQKKWSFFLILIFIESFSFSLFAQDSIKECGPLPPTSPLSALEVDNSFFPLTLLESPTTSPKDFTEIVSDYENAKRISNYLLMEKIEKDWLDDYQQKQNLWLLENSDKDLNESEQAYKFALEMNSEEFSDLHAANSGNFKILYRENDQINKKKIFPSWALIELVPEGIVGAKAIKDEMNLVSQLQKDGFPTTEFIPWSNQEGFIMKKFNGSYHPFVFVKWHEQSVLLDVKENLDEQTLQAILRGKHVVTNEAKAFSINRTHRKDIMGRKIDKEIGTNLINLLDKLTHYDKSIVDLQILVDVQTKEVIIIDPLDLIPKQSVRSLENPLLRKFLNKTSGWILQVKRKTNMILGETVKKGRLSSILEKL